jgi:hypothetical protein
VSPSASKIEHSDESFGFLEVNPDIIDKPLQCGGLFCLLKASLLSGIPRMLIDEVIRVCVYVEAISASAEECEKSRLACVAEKPGYRKAIDGLPTMS